MEPTRKLYRSRAHRTIAGVCCGLADYFGVDPTLIRVILCS
jgi:phage shock protein C